MGGSRSCGPEGAVPPPPEQGWLRVREGFNVCSRVQTQRGEALRGRGGSRRGESIEPSVI